MNFVPPHTGHGETLTLVSLRVVRREPPLERKPPFERNPPEELPDFDIEDSVVVLTTCQPPLQSVFVQRSVPFPWHFLHASMPVQLHFLQGCPNASSTSLRRSGCY